MGLTPGSVGHPGVCPYLHPEFETLRNRRGYSRERVLARWRRRTQFALRMGLGRGDRNKYSNPFFFDMGIGNPFSTPQAHIFMVRLALKVRAEHKQRGVR